MPECEEKNRQRAEFKKNYLAFKSDYKQVNDLYKEIHKQTDFYDNLDGIEGLILAYNIKNQKADISPYDYNYLLNKNLIENGELVEKDALSIITDIRPILNQTQEELVRSMGLAINLASSNNANLTADEKGIIELRNNIEEVFKNYFPEGAIVKYSDTYGNLIKNEINNATEQVGSYLIKDKNLIRDQVSTLETLGNYGINPYDIRLKIDKNYENINKFEEVVQKL